MKKLIFTVCAGFFSAGLFAQAPVLEVSAGQSYPVSIGVTNAITSNFSWTKPSDPNNILTNAFPLSTLNATTSSQTLTISGIASNGQQATVSVDATSVAGSCASTASNLIVRVSVPTFTATIPIATQSVCQNSTASNITVNIAGPAGSTINSFTYYVDANNNGVQDLPGEASTIVAVGAAAPTTGTINMAAFSTATAGIQAIRVISVNGTTSGGETRNSPQTGVNQAVTINAAPALGNFSF